MHKVGLKILIVTIILLSFGSSRAFGDNYVYAVGNDSGTTTAYLWVVDQQGNLVQTITLATSGTDVIAAYRVAVTDAYVYVAGRIGVNAALWSIPIDTLIPTTITLSAGIALDVAVAAANGNIYIAGQDSTSGHALLWIYSPGDITPPAPITLGTGTSARAYGIATAGSGVYAGGTINSIPMLWVTNLTGSSIIPVQLNTSGQVSGVTVSDTGVYIAASSTEFYITDFSGGNLQTIPTGATGGYNGIAFSSTTNEVYVVGLDSANHEMLLTISNTSGSSYENLSFGATSTYGTDTACSPSTAYNAGYNLASGTNAVLLLSDLNGNYQSTTQLGAGYAYGVAFYNPPPTPPPPAPTPTPPPTPPSSENNLWGENQTYTPCTSLMGL